MVPQRHDHIEGLRHPRLSLKAQRIRDAQDRDLHEGCFARAYGAVRAPTNFRHAS